MAQIHSFYISNLKNELKYYGKELSEGELHDSALALTTYATTENYIVLEQHEDAPESGNFEDISFITQGSSNMEFDPVTIVKSEFQFSNEDL
ncbi:13342_t:CDS:2 [Cetraspora pellucida]|uniref:13342_t:CDS:1 n=1 Tax=Cetraspora pellucida TaxID=1433469 RepID=A0ACA9K336_9GLOM|nr:13342_t:CDS:2 [Cetraspora pellucida]